MSQSTPAPAATNAATGQVKVRREPSSDESLNIDEYLRLGLPAHDRDWLGTDMVEAARVLGSLAQQGQRKLPRYQSQRSGAVFARLTARENLDVFKRRTLPLEARFLQASEYIHGSTQLFWTYAFAFDKNDVTDSEIVELMGAHLRLLVVMFEMIDELLVLLDKDDPKLQVRMQGLEQVRNGMTTFVNGGLLALTETNYYRASELVRLVGYMQETLPQLTPQLPPGSCTEFLLRLERLQSDPTLKELHAGLRLLHTRMKTAKKDSRE